MGYPGVMPKIGTIVRVMSRSGGMLQWGTPWENIQGVVPYDGRIIGLWYVAETEYEPEQFDVLAVPSIIFDTFVRLTQGADPEATFKALEVQVRAALAEDAKLPAHQRKGPPSAMRRSYFVKDGPFPFYESSMSIAEAFDHYNDRRLASEALDDEDEDDDEGDAPAEPAAQGGSAPTAPIPLAAQPFAPPQGQ